MSRRWDDATGVVTPEAVTLQFAEANVGSRSVALALDWIVIWTAVSILFTAFSLLFIAGAETAGAQPPAWVMVITLVVVNLGLFFGYPIGLETLLKGRTLGKMAMGLRVVTVEGAPIGFRHAAIRAALGLVDFYATLGMGAVFSTLLSRRHQRLGDKVAGTVVVRERSAEARPEALRFTVPPGAEGYAAGLDPSGLGGADYAAVRAFLLRAPGLDAARRAELAHLLATTLAAKLAHVPPAWVSPELFLVCLMARHQQRQPVEPPGPSREAAPNDVRAGWGDFAPPQ